MYLYVYVYTAICLPSKNTKNICYLDVHSTTCMLYV